MADLMFEQWRPVLGWEGLYEVSNLGRVRSLKRTIQKKDGKVYRCGGRILNQFLHHDYYVVRLRFMAGGKIAYVHRLVAESFVEGFFDGAVVNHKDENTHNNISENLEWCSNVYNLHYGNAHQKSNITRKRYYEDNKIPYPKSKAIEQYDMDWNYIQTFPSANIAGKVVGIKSSCISAAARGVTKYCKNFRWKYK